jgi:hypothetical protein
MLLSQYESEQAIADSLYPIGWGNPFKKISKERISVGPPFSQFRGVINTIPYLSSRSSTK